MRLVLPSLLLIACMAAALPAEARTPCESVNAGWNSLALLRKAQSDGLDASTRQRLQDSVADMANSDLPRLQRQADILSFQIQNGADAWSLLNSALSRDVPAELDRVSRERDCAPSSSESQASDLRDIAATSVAPDPEAFRESRPSGTAISAPSAASGNLRPTSSLATPSSLTAFFVMLTLLIAVPALIYLRRRSKAFLVREARRMLLEPVRVRVDEHEHVMTLVDLSMNGFKLKHEGPLEDASKLIVQLDGRWFAGAVRWSNSQFAGVKFNRPIDLETMAAVLGDEGALGLAA